MSNVFLGSSRPGLLFSISELLVWSPENEKSVKRTEFSFLLARKVPRFTLLVPKIITLSALISEPLKIARLPAEHLPVKRSARVRSEITFARCVYKIRGDRSRETYHHYRRMEGRIMISPARSARLPKVEESSTFCFDINGTACLNIGVNPEGPLHSISRRVGDRTYKGESPVLRGPSTVQRCRLPGRCVVPGSSPFWYCWYLSLAMPVSRNDIQNTRPDERVDCVTQ